MAKFLSDLEGKWLDDDARFCLDAPLIYESDVAGQTFVVPAGFVTDFASVPRVPVVYMLFGDRAHREAVVHDWLYQSHRVSKGMADKVFKEAMAARGKGWFTRWGMYLGVVIGGRSSYKSGPARFTVLNQIEGNKEAV